MTLLGFHIVFSSHADLQCLRFRERVARAGLGIKEAFLGKGNLVRFIIAFVIFLLQQVRKCFAYIYVSNRNCSGAGKIAWGTSSGLI